MSLNKRLISTGEAGDKYWGGEASWHNGSSYASVSRTLGFNPDIIWVNNAPNASSNTGGGYSQYNFILDRDFFGTDGFVKDTQSSSVYRSSASNVIDWNDDGFDLNYKTETCCAQSLAYNILYPNTKFVATCFKTSDTSITNTTGTISATEWYNADAKISKLKTTSGGSGQTVGHSLGQTPKWIMIMRMDSGWDSLSPGGNDGIEVATARYDTNLNCWTGRTPAFFDSSDNCASVSSNFSANSTTITLGSDSRWGGGTSNEYLIYLFGESSGFSDMDYFTGNSSTSLRTVWTGNFQPKMSFLFGDASMYQLSWAGANYSNNTISGTTYTYYRINKIETGATAPNYNLGTEYISTDSTRVRYATDASDLNYTGEYYAVMAFGGSKWNSTYL